MPLPKFREIARDFFWGAAHITSRELVDLLRAFGDEMFFQAQRAHAWSFQTNTTTQYAGGFYEWAGSVNDFDPSVNFGTANSPKSAHIAIVTGAITVDEVTIRVTGTSIDDNGVRTPADTDDIVIPSGTAANSYFEAKKFIGQVAIETVSGTAISCDYGWAKYFDLNNRDFVLIGFECLWESDSTDSTSDIELLHHKATGWTYGAGGTPTLPTPLATRSGDLNPEDVHEVGPGAWKRSNINQTITGSDTEGVLWRVTSGNTGVGTLSFRILNFDLTVRAISPNSLLE
jgi:hypothetical protein